MLGPDLRLSQAIERDCTELCRRNGLTVQETRTAIHIADNLARSVSLSSIEVMQTDEFWQYIGIQRRTVIDPSDALRKKVTLATVKGWQAQLDRIRVTLSAALE